VGAAGSDGGRPVYGCPAPPRVCLGARSSTVPDSDVGMAFAANKPTRHSQLSRNPFHAGGEFRGYYDTCNNK
jgi:hypothetical protein